MTHQQAAERLGALFAALGAATITQAYVLPRDYQKLAGQIKTLFAA